jgi:tRNA A37 methylthiotransferase MiaB
MNLADSDIVRSILLTEGYEMSEDVDTADLILTNTCAIRENAEDKIWQRLKYFQSLRKKARVEGTKPKGFPLIGVLGCMAERLKSKLIDDEGVDFVAGPDAYRSLPLLLKSSSTDQSDANSVLALDETYADIAPVRLAEGNTHAFVTITVSESIHT